MLLANTITADMGLIPGLAFVGPAMGLPLSVLAGFVERPFYSLAGVTRDALWYSLQANAVSLAVGFVVTLTTACIGDSLRSYYVIFEAGPFLAIVVSIVVERAYLLRKTGEPVRWRWTILGNVLSAAMCVGLLFLVVHLRTTMPQLRQPLRPLAVPLQLFAFIGSVALFVYAFIRPRRVLISVQ